MTDRSKISTLKNSKLSSTTRHKRFGSKVIYTQNLRILPLSIANKTQTATDIGFLTVLTYLHRGLSSTWWRWAFGSCRRTSSTSLGSGFEFLANFSFVRQIRQCFYFSDWGTEETIHKMSRGVSFKFQPQQTALVEKKRCNQFDMNQKWLACESTTHTFFDLKLGHNRPTKIKIQ